eukprot:2320553-Rhodomonas_salina.1
MADCTLDDGTPAEGGHIQNTSDAELGLGLGMAVVWEEEQALVNFEEGIGPVLRHVTTSKQ